MLTEAVAQFETSHPSHDLLLHVEKVTQGRAEVTVGQIRVVRVGEEIERPESSLEQRAGRRGSGKALSRFRSR